MNTNCAICRDPALRAAVDAALVAGARPAAVYRDLIEPGDHASLSSVYRHSRSHVESNLIPKWLGDSSSGEVLADLAAVARSAYEQHQIAILKGQSAAAARWAHESVAAFSALQRAGVENENEANAALDRDEFERVLGRYMYEHRDSIPAFVKIARAFGLHDLAADIDTSAEVFEEADAAHEKENHE